MSNGGIKIYYLLKGEEKYIDGGWAKKKRKNRDWDK